MNEKPTYNYTKRIEQTFPCGCHIDEMLDGSYGITYCQKHAAAPELYEALKAVKDKITELGDNEDIPLSSEAYELLIDWQTDILEVLYKAGYKTEADNEAS